MTMQWWHAVLWIVAAGGLGFLIPFVCADRLRLSRPLFLLCYVPLAVALLAGYLDHRASTSSSTRCC